MFGRFSDLLRISEETPGAEPDPALVGVPGYPEFAHRYAGCTFQQGLYRMHDRASASWGQAVLADAFPEMATRLRVFGYDWLGRQFAVDDERVQDGEPLVMLVEPGTGDALEIPETFVGFHERELVDHAEAALASDFFTRWSRSQPSLLPLHRRECVGYAVPLFLGGLDDLENLEVVDMEVYWSLCAQLLRGTRRLPPGGTVGSVSLGD